MNWIKRFLLKREYFIGSYWNKEKRLVRFEVKAKNIGAAILQLRKRSDFWAMCCISKSKEIRQKD